MTSELVERAASMLVEARRTVVLTGAGISTPSGIPDFRSPREGLWAQTEPEDVASLRAFMRDPGAFVAWLRPLLTRILQAEPNPAHRALAALEQAGLVQAIITQNIDGLHQKAGSRSVTELHGNLREIFCLACRRRYLAPRIPPGTPPRCDCGGVLKPNTVLFGEALPPAALERALREAAGCGCLLVVGTSALVQPAASLPSIAREHGAWVIEVNLERSAAAAELFLEGPAGVVLPQLAARVLAEREKAPR